MRNLEASRPEAPLTRQSAGGGSGRSWPATR